GGGGGGWVVPGGGCSFTLGWWGFLRARGWGFGRYGWGWKAGRGGRPRGRRDGGGGLWLWRTRRRAPGCSGYSRRARRSGSARSSGSCGWPTRLTGGHAGGRRRSTCCGRGRRCRLARARRRARRARGDGRRRGRPTGRVDREGRADGGPARTSQGGLARLDGLQRVATELVADTQALLLVPLTSIGDEDLAVLPDHPHADKGEVRRGTDLLRRRRLHLFARLLAAGGEEVPVHDCGRAHRRLRIPPLLR